MSLSSIRLSTTLSGTNTLAADLSARSEPISISIAKSIANGTASGQANRIFMDSRVAPINGDTPDIVDLHDFGGVSDGVGQSYALSRVVAIIIQHKGLVNTGSSDPNDHILVGGNVVSAFCEHTNGVSTSKIKIDNGGFLVLYSPAGYDVADGVANLLNVISETEGDTVNYDIIVVGS